MSAHRFAQLFLRGYSGSLRCLPIAMLARFIYPPVTGSLGRITRVGVLVAFCVHAAVGEVAHVTSGPYVFLQCG